MADDQIGYYSDLDQPIIPISVVANIGQEMQDVAFLVDTGVTAELIVHEDVAKALNWNLTSAITSVTMADDSQADAVWAYPYIKWNGQIKECRALVLLNSPDKDNSGRVRSSAKRAFDGFVGMQLLKGSVIHLQKRLIKISKGAQ